MGLDWRIDGTPAKDVMDEPPTFAVGETLTYSFKFVERQGDAQHERIDRHEAVRQRLRYATGEYHDTYQPIAAAPRYRDTSPDSSLLVGLSINEDESFPRYLANRAPEVWGVIVGGSDTSNKSGAFRGLELEVFVLARYDEYADRTAVENELHATGP